MNCKSDVLCEASQNRKLIKTPFKVKHIVSTFRPPELLHIDLFEPIDTASINGKKYGLIIVDDFNRWIWVKFLRSKNESYDVFSVLCKQTKNEKETSNLKIRCVYSGEFKK